MNTRGVYSYVTMNPLSLYTAGQNQKWIQRLKKLADPVPCARASI